MANAVGMWCNAAMPELSLRNLPAAVLSALRQRAARHGRSLEDEARAIVVAAVQAEASPALGTLLVDVGRDLRLTDEEVALLDQRDRSLSREVPLE
ncbi:FitA-like ribbon-helix-helix domain-containing protein [Caldimonas manganoxidans]|uniref:FitA-like ribbon-helix-helix domain-containing protein n=1 Tax=Caldimonas manganoxidans TaxID=196015 RepID=UPI000360AB2E